MTNKQAWLTPCLLLLLFIYGTKQSMASFMSIGTSTTWPRHMCACGYGQCLFKISRSHKNPERAYYVCLNLVKHAFQASDEWWDRMELINKSCAKFRNKNLEHWELMEIVFTEAATTGKHYWTSGEKTVEDNKGSSDSIKSLGMWPFTDPILSVGIDVEAESSMEGVEPRVDAGTKRKMNTPASLGKSRKPTSGASAIADSVNNLINVVRSQNQQLIVRHLTSNELLYTISECMERLKSILALVGTPLFHFASSLMDNADYREVMMCQHNDDHIIGWLTQKQLQSCIAAPFVNLFGA